MISLEGQCALVTGAGTRVGAAIAKGLGACGMRVAVHYGRSREGAEQCCAAIESAGGRAEAFQANLEKPGSGRELVERVLGRFGALGLLVPSAAMFERIAYDKMEAADLDRALSLNLRAPFELTQAATSALRKSRGSVVMITCASATAPYRHYLPYVVSKGALRQLVRTLALELSPEVRVNAVAPGTVLPPEDMPADALQALTSRTPLGRVGCAEDVADAVLYLARAPFVTGHEILVDGGSTLSSLIEF